MNGLKLRNGRVYCDVCNQSFLDEAACEPFLKDGETVTECIKRNRKDVDMVLRLLAEEKARVQELEAKVTKWASDLQWADGLCSTVAEMRAALTENKEK